MPWPTKVGASSVAVMPLPGVAIFWQMALPMDRTVTMDPIIKSWWYSLIMFDIMNALESWRVKWSPGTIQRMVEHLLVIQFPHSEIYVGTHTPGCIKLHPMAHVLLPPVLAFFLGSNALSNCANPRCTWQALIWIWIYVWQCRIMVWPKEAEHLVKCL